jgi:CheY-like chemotaxis protein
VDLPYLCTYIKTLHEEQAIEKNLQFKLDLQVLDFSITSDEYLLTGILSNLVNNAIKYTQTGMVLLELKPPLQYEGEKFALINVRDTGIGIKKEDYEIIFREFRQVSEGIQRDFEGLGLGLSVAKKMAKLLGIKILIESEYSKGSNFSVMIPLDKVTNSLKTKQDDAGLQNQKIPPQKSFHDRHLKILLVEDNLLNIEVIQLFLRKYWDVSFVRTGEDAIESAKNENYDLFLIDINLGQGIDGMEVLKRIREINSYKETPSIAITGYASEKHKKMFLENGFTRFLAKPVEKKELIDTINSIVRSN